MTKGTEDASPRVQAAEPFRLLALAIGPHSVPALAYLMTAHSGIPWAVLTSQPQSVDPILGDQTIHHGRMHLGSLSLFVSTSVALPTPSTLEQLFADFHLILAIGRIDNPTEGEALALAAVEAERQSKQLLPFAVIPFSFEGISQRRATLENLGRLSQGGRPVIVASCDWWLRISPGTRNLDAAEAYALELLAGSMSLIADLLDPSEPLPQNLHDLSAFLEGGELMAPAIARAKGQGRAESAARQLIGCYEAEGIDLKRSRKMLFSVYGDNSLTLHEVALMARSVSDELSDDTDVVSSMIVTGLEIDNVEIRALSGGYRLPGPGKLSLLNYSEALFESSTHPERRLPPSQEIDSIAILDRPFPLAKARVFLSSPSDVKRERKVVAQVIEEINLLASDLFGVFLELVAWETHVNPDVGRPQEIINQQIGSIDIFVGILGSRIGTSTGVAVSGTVEEFQVALESFERTGKPHILFYFSDKPPRGRGVAAAEQWLQVESFREQFQKKGLFWTYSSLTAFERAVYRHLFRVVRETART